MRYKDRKIESVAEMLAALRQQVKPKQLVWFRGHGRKDWKLVPALARKPSHLKAEAALMKRFMQNATPHLATQPREEWEWMFTMQHYGAWTRLLDWSESPLAALYLAVYNSNQTVGGAVWCLDPLALNKVARVKLPFESEIPAFSQDKVLESYLPSHVKESTAELNPIAIVGPRNTPRMVAQLGTFSMNHTLRDPIEEIGDGKHVWRWIIPGKGKKKILKELAHLGYTALTLFPELDRVADVSMELLDEV
jgi:hypothetical protein